ncbi:hypothetical protein HYPSUDRAFT_33540 [Hypholoma sublateritium FD-334 SS-4]|uniref:Uncharacterized protein n=1 Tax=Hypholoma sublateritium (strain FD-334 SS-4) TaxID=945553 RepID=A0A0D2MY64_HYPSF|nr:hypothetical protein HYPSUDRAFT_33540 [Hypholoma sublateritium FD-334 SS-4]
MAPGGFDGEIGRGRQRSGDESGSSRESSSERPTSNRVASPPLSDDGDTQMQSVADDDTPPPASRPLLRQALGFSSAQPKQSITTYQAVPEIVPARTPVFLPGQEVPIPLPTLPIPAVQGVPVTTPLKPGRPAKKPKRSKRPEAYPGQTSRFRVEAITPASNVDQSTDPGADPYASAHRGSVDHATNSGSSDSLTAGSATGSGSATAISSSSNPLRAATTPSNASKPPTRAKAPAASRAAPIGTPAVPLTTAQKNRLKYESHLNNQRNPNYSESSTAATAIQHQASTSRPASSTNRRTSAPPAGGTSTDYHRYEHHYESRSPPQYRERDHPQGYDGAPTSSNYAGYSAGSQSQRRMSRQPLRMVTLLIQDLRSGTVDHQLAEVTVPLKESDNPKDAGYWADAQDITHQLQNGPCRIDGPARAYTLRGKYRQFLLRVSANNVDEYMSANVVVHEDRTLDVVVEMLPPPGGPPPAPKIPPDIIGPNYNYESRQGQDSMDVDSHSGSRGTVKDNRKRINSPSFDDYDNPNSGQPSHPAANKTPRYSYYQHRTHEQSPRRGSPNYPGRSGMESPGRGRRSMTLDQAEYTFPGHTSMTPQRSTRSLSPQQRSLRDTRHDLSDDESMSPSPDGERFITAVSKILEADPTWVDFYRARATSKVSNVIKEYEFVTSKCNALRGTSVPGFSELVRDEHIIKALKIDETNYLENCNKTMDLYLLYGKQGHHHEDTRVIEMMNDNSLPKAGSNLYKRILHLLQDLDKQYGGVNGQTEVSRQRTQPPPPHQPVASGSDANQSDPRQGPRGTKGMFV